MTVSISKMSIGYYLDSAVSNDVDISGASNGLTAYYTETQTPAGSWFGRGLDGIGMAEGSTVDREQAIRLYEEGANPLTGETLGRRMQIPGRAPAAAKTPRGRLAMGTREGVAGFDLTFSVPKSVSTLWALGDFGMQTRIEAAHRQAMAETFEWIENNVAQTRAGHGGVAHVPIRGLIGTSFDHWESRDGDPQFHSHAVISNKVQRESDGEWVSLDSYTLHRHVVAISETYNSLLFDRLHQQVGTIAESRSGDADAALQAALNDAEEEQSPEPTKGRQQVELAGVPDELIEEFSSRSAAIEARTDELVADYRNHHGREPSRELINQLRQRATLETRQAKDSEGQQQTLAEKKQGWRSRAIAAGSSPKEVVREAVGHPDTSIRADMLDAAAVSTLSSWALADAATQRTTFTRANLIASSERVLRLVRCDSAEERAQLVDTVVDDALDKAVELTPRRSTVPSEHDPTVTNRGVSAFDHQRHAGVWTTQETLDAETYLLRRAEDRQAARWESEEEAEQRVAAVTTSSGHTLSADQAAATHGVLTSGRSLEAVIGPAGTGKTTTMSAISELWRERYGEAAVVGLAPSAVAAGVLGDELGATSENTSKWLYENTEGAARRAARVAQRSQELDRLEGAAGVGEKGRRRMEQLRTQLAADHAEQARYTMRENQLIIVDEASMVSNDQLHQLTRQADEAGAKVLMVGDPAQLGAVDAGGFLGHLDRHAEPHRLDQAWRFRNEWEREASLRLRTGDQQVLRTYEEQDRLHSPEEGSSAIQDAYAAWQRDRAEGKDSILIAADNETVAQLNSQARTDLVTAGEVDDSEVVTLRGEVTAGRGDVLLARRNDRSIRDESGAFIANGTRLTLTDVNPDGSAVAQNQSTGSAVVLDSTYLSDSTELGYATTAHRSQGVTVDTSHTVADEALSRELFYVALTRGKEGNHAYIEQPEEEHSPDHWGVLTETPRGETARELLQPVLARSTAERTAHEHQAAEAAYANDLGRMLNERQYLSWASRHTRTHEWVREHYSESIADQLETSPHWAELVDADPARTFDPNTQMASVARPTTSAGVDETEQDARQEIIDSIRAYCRDHEHHRSVLNDVVDDAEPYTGPQAEVLRQLDRDIVAETRSQQAALEREQPQWYRQLVAQHDDPHDRRRALDATLTWRALSDQTEADSALGTPPPAESRLRPHYDRAVERATPRQPWDEQQVRPAENFTTWVKSDAYTGPDPAVAVPDRGPRRTAPDPDPHHPQPSPQGPSRGPELG